MRSRASIAGHPLHAILVPVPIGAFVTALAFDALYLYFGDFAWLSAAFVATLLGVLALLVAIVPGLVDYVTTVPRAGPAWRAATVHMILGSVILLVYAGSLFAHAIAVIAPTPARANAATLIAVLALIFLGVQSFLGGELTFRHRVGILEGKETAPKLFARLKRHTRKARSERRA